MEQADDTFRTQMDDRMRAGRAQPGVMALFTAAKRDATKAQGVRDRDPETYTGYTNHVASHLAATSDGAVEHVYIDANTFHVTHGRPLAYATGLALFGLDLALPIGVFTGLAVFVPYLGFGLGLLLALLAALLQFEPGHALLVVAVFSRHPAALTWARQRLEDGALREEPLQVQPDADGRQHVGVTDDVCLGCSSHYSIIPLLSNNGPLSRPTLTVLDAYFP